MALTETSTSTAGAGIQLQARSYNLSKYRVLSDPEVATAPMGIVLDSDKCIGCGLCVMQCPCQVLSLTSRASRSVLQSAPCTNSCPAGIAVPEYLKLMSDGASLEAAWTVITQTNPFPAITGRVCPHPCESACNRNLLDEAVNINCIERAVGDFGIERMLAFPKPAVVRVEKIAVVGAGPAGMSCAYQLALMGYQVTVFEAGSRAGGMLASTIPSFRLPESVVQQEMTRITALGVTLLLNTAVGKDISLEAMKADFDAIYVAIGAHGSPVLGIPGETADNVLSGLTFLKSVKDRKPPRLEEHVIVIGGGNTGIDAARSARRLGSRVTMLYRRTTAEMPADAAEVEAAKDEGVEIRFLSAPVKISGDGAGAVLTCQKMALGDEDASGRRRPISVEGSEFVLVGTVIAAVGQIISAAGLEGMVGSTKWIDADRTGQTLQSKVFAGGDAVSGPALVVEAIGAGRMAARGIDAFIRKVELDLPEKRVISFKGVPLDKLRHLGRPEHVVRNESAKLAPPLRLAQPEADEHLSFSRSQAVCESKRCFECGQYAVEYGAVLNTPYFGEVCVACHNCDAICPQGAITMNGFYRVDEGRWATSHDVPAEVHDGLPNPLRLSRPSPFAEIESRITAVERVIYKRRSTRIFNPEPLPKEIIERVLEAGRFAPTAGNCEGVKYVVITDRKLMDELDESTRNFVAPYAKMYMSKRPAMMLLKKLLALFLPNGSDPRPMAAITGVLNPQFGDGPMNVFFDAPCAIMVVPHALHISDPEFDSGIICQNMVLAAHSLGLGTCYAGFPVNTIKSDKKTMIKFKQRLGLEWPFEKPAMIILLGYPKTPTDNAVPRLFPKVHWVL